VTLNVAACPSVTVIFDGSVVIVGGTGFTRSTADELVALPYAFVTTHRNAMPLSVSAAAGVVYAGFVAPAIVTLFLCH